MATADEIVYYIFISTLTVTGICMNVFFAFCMLFDQQRSIKPPLSVLVGTAVFHNILLQASVLFFSFSEFWDQNKDLMPVMVLMVGIIIYAGLSVMSTNVWLSTFYYTKIVSSQSAALAWVKRNITMVVYGGLVVDKLYLVTFVFTLTMNNLMGHANTTNSTHNVTHAQSNTSTWSVGNATAGGEQELSSWNDVVRGFTYFHVVYLLLFIALMCWVWGCTLVYLCRHIRRMEGSASPFSSPQLRCQVRVAIQGIVQTLLYIVCAVGQFVTLFPIWLSLDEYARGIIHNVSVGFYALGTTINMGCGQHLFREKTVQILTGVKSRACWKCEKAV